MLPMTAMAPQFSYIMNRKLQPDSNVLRIHIPYVMDTLSWKEATPPRWHSYEDMDKYWLVRSPPSDPEPPDVGLTRIRSEPRTQPSQAKSGKMRLYVKYACAIGTRLNLKLLCVAQNGVVSELHRYRSSPNCQSCQFANKRAERGYYDESDIVLCVK